PGAVRGMLSEAELAAKYGCEGNGLALFLVVGLGDRARRGLLILRPAFLLEEAVAERRADSDAVDVLGEEAALLDVGGADLAGVEFHGDVDARPRRAVISRSDGAHRD